MNSIDDIKAITIDGKTFEAAKSGMRSPQVIIERLQTDRLDPADRTTLATLLQKAQIGSRPFDAAERADA